MKDGVEGHSTLPAGKEFFFSPSAKALLVK
jgi:hypothetical protein